MHRAPIYPVPSHQTQGRGREGGLRRKRLNREEKGVPELRSHQKIAIQVKKAGELLKEPMSPITASIRGSQGDPSTGGHLEL